MLGASKSLDRRIVIVTRPTRLDNILAKENTISQARFKLSSLNRISKSISQSDETNTELEVYEAEHSKYHDSIQLVRQQIDPIAPVQLLDRKYLPNFVFSETDIIICLGQDGLVANTMKYLDGQPVIGVNPDKNTYDGVLLPFEPKDVLNIVSEVAVNKRKSRTVRMGEAKLPDGQSLLAVNDFFIGQRSHVSARYVIKFNGLKEPQSSSGVIISTGLGSTGWMKSIIAGSKGISSAVIGNLYGSSQQNENLLEVDEEEVLDMPQVDYMDISIEPSYEEARPDERMRRPSVKIAETTEVMAPTPPALSNKAVLKRKKEYGLTELSDVVGQWESKDLLFAVREPFSSKTSGTGIVFGKIVNGENLRIESLMGENGVIFSDGIESDFLEFNSGMEVTITLASKTGNIII